MVELYIDIKKIENAIKKNRAKKVLVQAPAGVKMKLNNLLQDLENRLYTTFIISADSCFGACDIPIGTISAIKPDLVIHIGHEKMIKMKGIVYIPLRYEFNHAEKEELLRILYEHLSSSGIKKVCGTATAQYLLLLKWLKKEAKRLGISILLKKGRHEKKGMVLGCETKAAECNAENVLFVGDGFFHAIGISKNTGKNVIILDPLSKKISLLSFKDIEKKLIKRNFAMLKAYHAKNFGVVMSTKPGQFFEREAFEAKRILEKNGRKAVLIATEIVSETSLLDFMLDCYVIIACPRISDDLAHWKTPAITFEELKTIFKKA
ncbi:MAG: diphthamide biosynthesis enzyme Dph2 [Candidatus Diapherotrites archaeon]|nr:diphthamide biosynthesis enzyme Dph2 [Candidatus Diapherotrites archaeon]